MGVSVGSDTVQIFLHFASASRVSTVQGQPTRRPLHRIVHSTMTEAASTKAH